MDTLPTAGHPVPAGEAASAVAVPAEPVKHTRIFTRTERICAWLLILCGFGLFRARPVYRYPLGTMLLLWGLFVLTAVLLTRNGRRIRGTAAAAAVSALPVSLALFFSANAMIHLAAALYCFAACAYTVYAACGNALEEGLSDLLPIDLIRTLLILPFAAPGGLIHAIGAGRGLKQSGKVLLRVLGGLFLALVPTGIVIALLSYDREFNSSLNGLYDGVTELLRGGFSAWISSFLLGLVLAVYLFGLYVSASENRRREILTLLQCQKASGRVHSISPITTVSAVLPVLGIYGVFFFSQWEHYMSAFTGILPENLRYADYAREGFFELCTVSCINLCLLAATGLFTRRREGDGGRAHPALRTLHVLLSLCTLILIATAMSKMMLYIEAYGLTPKRVYAAWFMAVLALVFLLVIVKQFCPRMKLVALSMGVCIGMFAGLGLSDADGRIAEYNVDRYLEGTLEELDTAALLELGDAAVPARIRAGVYTEDTAETEGTLFSTTLPGLRAKAAASAVPSPH